MACVNTENNKLYYNLVSLCEDEAQARDLYARCMNPDFIRDYKVKTDKDGVPVFRDVYKKANLGRYVREEKVITTLNGRLNARSLNYTQTNLNTLSDEVVLFNRDNEVSGYVAVIERHGDKLESKVVGRDVKTEGLAKQIQTNSALNDFLKGKLAEIGVSVGAVDELERRRGVAGVTDFDKAKDATNGVVELIRISKDEKGAQALPEEFSHFALEAVGDSHPLVRRLYNLIDENVMAAVLGEQYDRYLEEYEYDTEKLKKEVAGKLLAEYLKAEYTGEGGRLLERVFGAVKQKFGSLDENDFRAALIDLDATLTEAAKKILFTDLLREVGLSNIRTGGRLYNLDDGIVDDDGDTGVPTGDGFPDGFLSESQDKKRKKDGRKKKKSKRKSKKKQAEDDGIDINEGGEEVVNEVVNEVFDEGIPSDFVEGAPNEMPDEGISEVFDYDEGVDPEIDDLPDDFDSDIGSEVPEDTGTDDFEGFTIADDGVEIGENFEVMESQNKANSLNRIDVEKLKEEFDDDCRALNEYLDEKGEQDAISKMWLNIESSLTKLNMLNKKKGFVFSAFDSKEKAFEYLYKRKNMLGNLLYFVHNSIENLATVWKYYETTKDEAQACDNLLVLKNTISSLEYILNTTDMQNVMDVLSMEFDEEADTKIQEVIGKYVKELSYRLNQAKQFVENETMLVTKSILSERFGDKFEIPMTLSESKTLTLDNELSNGTQEDVSSLTRFFSSMQNSPSLILKMVDQIVKKSNDKRRNKVYDLRRKIIALGKQYVKESGSDDFSFMYQKDKEGNRTGFYIDETDWERYDRMFKKMVTDKKDKWCPDGKFNKRKFGEYMKKFQTYFEKKNKFRNKAWDKLTPAQRKYAEEFIAIKKELDDHMYYEHETIYDTDAFPELEGINQADADEFYDDWAQSGDRVARLKAEHKEFMRRRRACKTIKIEKSLINKLKSAKSMKGVKDELQRALKEMFIKTSSDVEIGEQSKAYQTDFEGNRVYDIPKLFTQKKDTESEENMSMDAVSTLVAYADAAENRYEKQQIVSLLEMITDIVNQRQLAVTKGKTVQMRKFKTNFGEFSLPIVTKGSESNISKMLKDYLESQVYGMWNAELGNFGDTNISKDKVGNLVMSQTALTGMALNVLGGISNVETGKAMMRMESICGQFFNMKDVAKADLEYTKNIGGVIANAGELIKDNKMAVFIEQFNILQEYETTVLHTEFDTNNFARCCSEQGLFILNNLGEHFLQTRTALSVAFATKVKGKDGKEMTLWEAMELRDIDPEHPEYGKKIFLKDGVTKLDGSEIGDMQEYFDKFSRKVAAINQRMHGIYNYEDRCAAQRYMAGRFFYQFRKYIPVSIQRRFGQAQYNFDLDGVTEGYYRTFAKFWKKVYTETKAKRGSLLTVWKSMNEWERQNCIRSIVEMSQTLLVWASTFAVSAMMGDDKKQSPWALKMLYYQTNRLYTELASFTPSTGMLNEALKLIDSPAAGIRIMDKNIEFLEVIKPWNWMEDAEIEQGKYKGHTKGYKAFMQILPIYNSWMNLYDPYEAAKFYNH